jgi:hypothetical protein
MQIYPPAALYAYKKEPHHFSADIKAACEKIQEACLGLGTDEGALIDVLGPRSAEDRALIGYCYKEQFGNTLQEQIKSEVGGDFGYLMRLACMSLPEAEAYVLYHAMKGMGTSESLMYPILLGRSDEEMDCLKQTFFDMYNTDLGVTMNDDLSGDFKAVCMLAIQSPIVEYKSSFHTRDKATKDAEVLYNAGEGKWGTDEGSFIKILLTSPKEHIAHMNEVYQEKYKNTIVGAIESEFGGTATKALVFFVRMALEPYNALAELFESAMKGIGTDEKSLSSSVIRYHQYLDKICQSYQSKYNKSLLERIEGETKGNYGRLILSIFDAPRY